MTTPAEHAGRSMPRLISGFTWKLFSNAGVLLFGLALSVAITRVYGQQGYGQLVIVFTMTSIAAGIAGLGSKPTLIRYVPLFRKRLDVSSLWQLVVTAGLVQLGGIAFLTAVMWRGNNWLAEGLFGKPEVAGLLKVGVFYFICFSLVMFTFSLLQALEDWMAESCLSVAYPALYLAIVLFAIMQWHVGVAGVLYSNMAAALLASAIGLWRIRSVIAGFGGKHSITLDGIAHQGRSIFSFGLPLALGELGYVLMMWVDKAILGRYVSLEELALYYIAVIFYSGLSTLFKTLDTVLMPSVSRLTDEGGEAISRVFRSLNFWYLHIGIVATLGAYFLISPIIELLYGPHYEGAVRAFRLLLVLFLLRAAFLPSWMFLVNVFGKSKELSLVSTARAAFTVLLFFFLIPHFGYEGAIIAMIATYVLFFGPFLASRKEIRAVFPGALMLKSAGLVAAIVVLLFVLQRGFGVANGVGLFLSVAAGYGGGLIGFKLIGPQERHMFTEALHSFPLFRSTRIRPVGSEATTSSEQMQF